MLKAWGKRKGTIACVDHVPRGQSNVFFKPLCRCFLFSYSSLALSARLAHHVLVDRPPHFTPSRPVPVNQSRSERGDAQPQPWLR